jgi:hypothetical protein
MPTLMSGRTERSRRPLLEPGGAAVRGSARAFRSAIVVALISAAVLACSSPAPASPSPIVTSAPSPTPTATPTAAPTAVPTPALIHRHLSGNGYGLSFDYPADWNPVPFFFLASFTNGDILALIPTCCRLRPNQLAVSISCCSGAVPIDLAGFKPPDFDVRSVGDWLVVQQMMPADPSNFVDVHEYWIIGRLGPEEAIYSISAIFRGPDLAPMQAQVDAFVDSIVLDPRPAASPS